jgi:hypothetical protein
MPTHGAIGARASAPWVSVFGPQFAIDAETGRSYPVVLVFTDFDKRFLASVGWASTTIKVTNV